MIAELPACSHHLCRLLHDITKSAEPSHVSHSANIQLGVDPTLFVQAKLSVQGCLTAAPSTMHGQTDGNCKPRRHDKQSICSDTNKLVGSGIIVIIKGVAIRGTGSQHESEALLGCIVQ